MLSSSLGDTWIGEEEEEDATGKDDTEAVKRSSETFSEVIEVLGVDEVRVDDNAGGGDGDRSLMWCLPVDCTRRPRRVSSSRSRTPYASRDRVNNLSLNPRFVDVSGGADGSAWCITGVSAAPARDQEFCSQDPTTHLYRIPAGGPYCLSELKSAFIDFWVQHSKGKFSTVEQQIVLIKYVPGTAVGSSRDLLSSHMLLTRLVYS